MRSVEFARTYGVPLHVRSSFTWEPGTWVTEEDPPWSRPSSPPSPTTLSEAKVTVTGVPDRPGIAARLFRALADRDVNVDMIVQNVSDDGVDRHLLHRAARPTSTPRGEVTERAGRARSAPAASATDADIGRVSASSAPA